jgi:hypothetical protein
MANSVTFYVWAVPAFTSGSPVDHTWVTTFEAWSKSAPSLEEYDYYLRGHQLYFRFTKGRQCQGARDLAGRVGTVRPSEIAKNKGRCGGDLRVWEKNDNLYRFQNSWFR